MLKRRTVSPSLFLTSLMSVACTDERNAPVSIFAGTPNDVSTKSTGSARPIIDWYFGMISFAYAFNHKAHKSNSVILHIVAYFYIFGNTLICYLPLVTRQYARAMTPQIISRIIIIIGINPLWLAVSFFI